MRSVFSTLSCLLGLASLGASQDLKPIDDHAKAVYYVLRKAGYVFALNVVENGDVYYHMNAPASHSWMGIGFGPTMTNTRMLISYLSADGHNLTNTCRMSSGRSEPVNEPDIVIDGVYDDLYAPFANTLSPDGIMIAHAICRNCSKWTNGEIDINNTAAQFIFALGPNNTVRSDSPEADLKIHQFHGTFTMDMTMATNLTGDYGRVPAPQDPGLQVGYGYSAFANYYSSLDYDTGTDSNWGPTVHGIFMCLAFLLVFPLGAIMLRLTKRAFIHAAAQFLGVVLILIGFGIACYTSTIYNKVSVICNRFSRPALTERQSKHFNSTHQILGFLIMAMILIQLGLGLSHHAFYVRTKSPTIMGAIHRFLGIIVIVLGLINAGVGFNFSGNSFGNIPYGVVAGVMVVIFAVIIGFMTFYNRRGVYKPEKGPYIPSDYYTDEPDQYEMSEQPFSNVAYVQTPRTPRYPDGQGKVEHDPEGYHNFQMQGEERFRNGSLRLDTATSSQGVAPASSWNAIR